MYIKFDIPDVSRYASEASQYWGKSLFIKTASDRYQINALTSTYVRLVESAIFEYQSGEKNLREFWGTHSSLNLAAHRRSVSNFETCISNMHRAIACFRRLRGDKDSDPLSTHLKVKASFATDAIAKRVKDVRDAIHHLDEKVMYGKISEGEVFMLAPDGLEVPHPSEPNQTIKTIDRLVIGRLEISFRELAGWLKEMSELAARIADFLPDSTQPPLENG